MKQYLQSSLRRAAAACTAVALAASLLPVIPASAATTLTVGKNGTYKTVGAAVSAAAALNPNGEGSRVTIAIEPGTYREQLLINTPYLSFVNSNPAGGDVVLTWYYGIGYKYYSSASTGYYNAGDAQSRSAKGIAQRWGTSVRLQSRATYFRAENIKFENSFNLYMTDEEIADGVEATGETLTVQRNKGLDVRAKSATERAAALCAEAENCEFYNCTFTSSQDTLYTASTCYFKNCKIQGNTDYIFGSGNVVFDSCELCFGGYSDRAVGGYITAAREQNKGYLFYECTVTANSALKQTAGYYGRPWKDSAHVLFYKTKLQNESIITPVGWTSMSGVEPWQATFREYGTTTVSGGGVNTGSRTGGTVLSSCNATREEYLGNWMPYYLNAGTGGKPAASVNTSEPFRIRNVNSGLYLSAEGNTAANGTNVIQAQKQDASSWNLRPGAGGYYYFYANIGDGQTYLLDLDYGKTEDGTNLGLYENTKSDAQLFKLVADEAGGYVICTKPTQDESCLSISGGSKEAGANVEQRVCKETADQRWELEPYIPPIQGELIRDLIVLDRGNSADWSVAQNTQEGSPLFGDRDVVYVGLPDALTGAERIMTACDSKNYDADLAECTFSAPATVYICMDTRVTPKPGWLADWTLTDLHCQNSDASTTVSFEFYSRVFKAGETAVLGTNGMNGKCVNYTVFAVPFEDPATVTTTTTVTTTETTTTTTVTTTAEPDVPGGTDAPQPVLRGDADCNGTVTVGDAVLIARLAGMDDKVNSEMTDEGLLNADVDGNGLFTGNDCTLVCRFLARLDTL